MIEMLNWTTLSVATIAAGSYLTHALRGQFCASNAIWAKSILKSIVKESLEEVIEEVFLEGHTFHNIYLCDSDGVYLNSRVEIQEDGSNKKFSVRKDDKWYTAFTSTTSKDNKRDDLYVAFGIDTSVQYLCFLQKTEVSLSKGKIYEKYFPKESIKYLPKSSYKLIHLKREL